MNSLFNVKGFNRHTRKVSVFGVRKNEEPKDYKNVVGYGLHVLIMSQ